MNQRKLTEFKVLSFDCYGTLVDWESGLHNALMPLLKRGNIELDREQILTVFALHEVAQQAETPKMVYSELLVEVHRRLSREWGVSFPEEERRNFGNSVPNWPVFADTASALQYLKRYYKLVILSNIDRRSFSQTNHKLGVRFDAIFTAEDIGSYKPDPRNFQYLIEQLAAIGYKRAEILHTAQSLFHDHTPANAVNLASAWIDRRQGLTGWGATAAPAHIPHFHFRFSSLAEMVRAHIDELRVSP